MVKELILNLYQEINLHINFLICIVVLNFSLVSVKILQRLPRNVFIDRPLDVWKKTWSLIRFLLSYIFFYPFFRHFLKGWNFRKEDPDYTRFTKDYTARKDVWFSYYYLRCEVIRANFYIFFWSKTIKLKACFIFFFNGLILNYYSIWVFYWVIIMFRWFMLHMSQRLIIFCWRIMLWIRIQIFIYINIDTFFSLLQSFNFVELEEDEDFVLDSPPFIFYYTLRKFFIKKFSKRYTRKSLYKVEFLKYIDFIIFNLLKVIFGKLVEFFYFYYSKTLLLFGFFMFYIFDNFNYIKLYLNLELNYWNFFLNTDYNSFREFLKELLKICYMPFVYLFFSFCLFMKKIFYNLYLIIKNFFLPYKNKASQFFVNVIYIINLIVFNSVVLIVAFIYYFIRFTFFFRVLIFLMICFFLVDFKMLLTYIVQYLSFLTENLFYLDLDTYHEPYKQIFFTRKYPRTEKIRYYKQGWLAKYLEVPKKMRKKRGFITYEVGKYYTLRKKDMVLIKLYKYRIRRWWKLKKWFDKLYYFKYAIIISKIKIMKYTWHRKFIRTFMYSKYLFIHKFFVTDLMSFYFLAFIEICFYLLAKWYAIVLYAVPSGIDYNYILYFCASVYYYGKLILSYIFSIIFEKFFIFTQFILIVINFFFQTVQKFILFLNTHLKVQSFNYLIWYLYIITKDLFSYDYLPNNLIDQIPSIAFRPTFIIGPSPAPGSISFWEWLNYFLNLTISFYHLVKWIIKFILFFVRTMCLMFDYMMSYYAYEGLGIFNFKMKIKLFMEMRFYLWRFFQKIIDFFSINYDVYRHRYDEHQRIATIRRRRTHPYFKMKFRSRTNSFLSYKRWGLTPKLMLLWDFDHLKTNRRWQTRNIQRSRIIVNYLFHSVVKKGRRMWSPRLPHFRLSPKKYYFPTYLQFIWMHNILKLNYYCIYFYPFLILFLCLFRGFRKLVIKDDLQNVNAEYYWRRFRSEPLENLNWLLFKIDPLVRKELEKLRVEFAEGGLEELISEQQQPNLDPEILKFESEAKKAKKLEFTTLFFNKLNFKFDIHVIRNRQKILNKLEKDNTDFMHYYLSPFFEKFYFNLLINSFVMSCIVSSGATKNENLENALSMAADIEPIERLNYDWFSQMEPITQQVSDYLFYLDKNIFFFKLPSWVYHKNILHYQILPLKIEGDTTFEKYKYEYFHMPEQASVIGHYFLLFLIIPTLLLNLYFKSVGYHIAGCGRGISMEWMQYFLNYYLRSDFIFSIHAQMSNVGLNVRGHRRNRSNYTGSWTPFRGRFRWGYLLRKRSLRYTHAWGDIVLTFRKQYTYSRLYFYKHLSFFNYCSYIFVIYICYIFIVLLFFFIFFNFLKTENYMDKDIPGRNFRDLSLGQDLALLRLGYCLKVAKANIRKILIKKL